MPRQNTFVEALTEAFIDAFIDILVMIEKLIAWIGVID